jgi:steroid 5-alpha reductase family enzyme
MPISLIGMGFTFNTLNALLNGIALTHLNPGYSADWLVDPRFIIGVAIFSIGFTVNIHSDHVLRSLRKADETGYRIPYGGFFRWISSPNYFGEIMEWCGWTLASWSLAGGAFACFTFANLAPRAWAHHKWYRANFKEYPPTRKALIPGLI